VERFRDRVAIVTGAGAPGGIGAAVARKFVAEGGRVVLGATSERVHERAAELGDSAIGVIADLTVDGAANTLVRVALDRWDRLDVLVNNAGMTSVSSRDGGGGGGRWPRSAGDLATALRFTGRSPIGVTLPLSRHVLIGRPEPCGASPATRRSCPGR
jgi:3-oxoacyl-[acyl-carrier protein] reductase